MWVEVSNVSKGEVVEYDLEVFIKRLEGGLRNACEISGRRTVNANETLMIPLQLFGMREIMVAVEFACKSFCHLFLNLFLVRFFFVLGGQAAIISYFALPRHRTIH